MLESLIEAGQSKGASDLHLETGFAPVFRINGELKSSGTPLKGDMLLSAAKHYIGEENWDIFLNQYSFDLSTNIKGVRCRINIMKTTRGIGFAIRLLSGFEPTIEKLNLHPDFYEITKRSHGLVLISGPTGSGKSSTLAALIQAINLTHAKHILTIESPIEYHLSPVKSLIRQREVGRDTPSFYQGLIDSLREDPDILMVGEMRDADTMIQTINAAETGHLVFTTVHSGSVAEALHRITASIPSDAQMSVRTQLADALVGIVCQRLKFIKGPNIRVPECEILFNTYAVKNIIREGKFFKLNDLIQTSAEDKMWSFDRYRQWLDQKTNWYIESHHDEKIPEEKKEDMGGLNIRREIFSNKKVVKKNNPMQSYTEKNTSPPTPTEKFNIKKTTNENNPYYEIDPNADVNDLLELLKKKKPPKT